MKKKFKTQLKILYFNYLFHCYRRTGVKILTLSEDFKFCQICIPLNWKTRGFFGTLFGGSIYGAVDPVLMVMFNMILGKNYVVWDKAATIRFLKPGKTDLFANFEISDEHIERVKAEVNENGKTEIEYVVAVQDNSGIDHAIIEKVLHIRGKSPR